MSPAVTTKKAMTRVHHQTRQRDGPRRALPPFPTLAAVLALMLVLASRYAIATKIAELPEQLRRSLTWDCG